MNGGDYVISFYHAMEALVFLIACRHYEAEISCYHAMAALGCLGCLLNDDAMDCLSFLLILATVHSAVHSTHEVADVISFYHAMEALVCVISCVAALVFLIAGRHEAVISLSLLRKVVRWVRGVVLWEGQSLLL